MLKRGAPDYEAARTAAVWNRLVPSRFPDEIVRPTNVDDVVAALRLARSRALSVAVRSGGHSFTGAQLRDGGILIDLSDMRQITIDAERQIASVRPAVAATELTAALEPHGLAFPVGHCPTVGLGGFLLAGGLGWNAGCWGPACHSIEAVEVVLASGEVVRADETTNPELLWAARGAGPGFPGVVTEFHLRVHPLPRTIKTANRTYRLEELPQVASWIDRLTDALPPYVELATRLAAVPAGSGSPQVLVTATAFAESDADADAALAPIGSPTATPIPALHAWLGGYFPDAHRYQAEAIWSEADPVELMSALARTYSHAPSPLSLAIAVVAPRRVHRSQGPPAAFSALGRTFAGAYAVWRDEDADDINRAWHKRAANELESMASGFYIGETNLFAAGRAQASFGTETWNRLESVRQVADPEGVFGSFPADRSSGG